MSISPKAYNMFESANHYQSIFKQETWLQYFFRYTSEITQKAEGLTAHNTRENAEH